MFVFDVKEAADMAFEGEQGDNEEDPLVIEDEVEEPVKMEQGDAEHGDELVAEVIN